MPDTQEPISKDLISYRLDELKTSISGLKTDIAGLSGEVKTMAGSGCIVGKENKMEIELIKADIVILKAKPKETIKFIGVLLALIIAIFGALVYLHDTLPTKGNQGNRGMQGEQGIPGVPGKVIQ